MLVVYLFNRSLVHSSIHPFIHSSIHPFIHSSIHPSIHPFIHSSIHANANSNLGQEVFTHEFCFLVFLSKMCHKKVWQFSDILYSTSGTRSQNPLLIFNQWDTFTEPTPYIQPVGHVHRTHSLYSTSGTRSQNPLLIVNQLETFTEPTPHSQPAGHVHRTHSS